MADGKFDMILRDVTPSHIAPWEPHYLCINDQLRSCFHRPSQSLCIISETCGWLIAFAVSSSYVRDSGERFESCPRSLDQGSRVGKLGT